MQSFFFLFLGEIATGYLPWISESNVALGALLLGALLTDSGTPRDTGRGNFREH